MHLTSRHSRTSRIVSLFVAVALTTGLSLNFSTDIARADNSSGTVSSSVRDANLKALLQKRLLIPEIKNINLGPPSPGPFPGVASRTVTIMSSEGQKAEIEVFYDESGTHGIIAQRYAVFDSAHPWEKMDVSQIDLKDRPSMGPPNAPITIIEFADFECPYCAHAFGEIDSMVNNTYKGQVRLIWKNFPLNMHPWAEQAAIAAECAKQQNPDAFWGFARDLYRDQTEITPQNLRSHIDEYTKSLGLDDKVLDACILGKAADAYVQQDLKDGNTVHVNSTPTFIINGVPVIGLPSSQTFDFVVKSQLKEAKGGH